MYIPTEINSRSHDTTGFGKNKKIARPTSYFSVVLHIPEAHPFEVGVLRGGESHEQEELRMADRNIE
jgi:hypothetical protein